MTLWRCKVDFNNKRTYLIREGILDVPNINGGLLTYVVQSGYVLGVQNTVTGTPATRTDSTTRDILDAFFDFRSSTAVVSAIVLKKQPVMESNNLVSSIVKDYVSYSFSTENTRNVWNDGIIKHNVASSQYVPIINYIAFGVEQAARDEAYANKVNDISKRAIQFVQNKENISNTLLTNLNISLDGLLNENFDTLTKILNIDKSPLRTSQSFRDFQEYAFNHVLEDVTTVPQNEVADRRAETARINNVLSIVPQLTKQVGDEKGLKLAEQLLAVVVENAHQDFLPALRANNDLYNQIINVVGKKAFENEFGKGVVKKLNKLNKPSKAVGDNKKVLKGHNNERVADSVETIDNINPKPNINPEETAKIRHFATNLARNGVVDKNVSHTFLSRVIKDGFWTDEQQPKDFVWTEHLLEDYMKLDQALNGFTRRSNEATTARQMANEVYSKFISATFNKDNVKLFGTQNADGTPYNLEEQVPYAIKQQTRVVRFLSDAYQLPELSEHVEYGLSRARRCNNISKGIIDYYNNYGTQSSISDSALSVHMSSYAFDPHYLNYQQYVIDTVMSGDNSQQNLQSQARIQRIAKIADHLATTNNQPLFEELMDELDKNPNSELEDFTEKLVKKYPSMLNDENLAVVGKRWMEKHAEEMQRLKEAPANVLDEPLPRRTVFGVIKKGINFVGDAVHGAVDFGKTVLTRVKPEVEQPKTEVEQPTTEVEQPKTEAEQPKTEVEQPKTEVEQPKTEVEHNTAIRWVDGKDENGNLQLTANGITRTLYFSDEARKVLEEQSDNIAAFKDKGFTYLEGQCKQGVPFEKAADLTGEWCKNNPESGANGLSGDAATENSENYLRNIASSQTENAYNSASVEDQNWMFDAVVAKLSGAIEKRTESQGKLNSDTLSATERIAHENYIKMINNFEEFIVKRLGGSLDKIRNRENPNNGTNHLQIDEKTMQVLKANQKIVTLAGLEYLANQNIQLDKVLPKLAEVGDKYSFDQYRKEEQAPQYNYQTVKYEGWHLPKDAERKAIEQMWKWYKDNAGKWHNEVTIIEEPHLLGYPKEKPAEEKKEEPVVQEKQDENNNVNNNGGEQATFYVAEKEYEEFVDGHLTKDNKDKEKGGNSKGKNEGGMER